MAKNNKNEKDLKAKEKELFDTPVVNPEAAAVENQEGEKEMEMELEMELDGEEIQGEMEELVAEKVKKEEKDNQEQKSKRGPKPKDKADEDKKPAEKKEKALNLKDQNIIQREIKKGRLSAPQGRIEKTEAGDYVMKMADGIIFPNDAKGNYKEVEKVAKMNDGKFILTMHAANSLKVEKFKAVHENGEEVEHDFVRVELHKPGRDKDVTELFTVREAKNFLNVKDAVLKKKEEEAKKKEEKAAKEKAAKEEAEKETKKEEETKA